MDAQPSEIASIDSVKQLRRTRHFLKGKLAHISRRLTNEAENDEAGTLTFTLAQRNFIQGNLERVERQLLLARISTSISRDTVGIGNVVYIQRGNDIRAIMLIPAANSNADIEYVPANSALGKALRGKRVGGSVEIKTSLGKQNYGILKIT